jgi:hypothetical protein
MSKTKALFAAFFALALSANLYAEAMKKGEFSLAGGIFFTGNDGTAFGAVSLGAHSKFIGIEANGAVFRGSGILGANLVLGTFGAKYVIPYATAGVCTNTFGYIGFNGGGGIKFKVSEITAFRIEYRHYFLGGGGWDADTFIGGISLFF